MVAPTTIIGSNPANSVTAKPIPAPATSPRSALHKRISFKPNMLKNIPITVVTISAIIMFSLTT